MTLDTTSTWPLARLGEAIEALGAVCGLALATRTIEVPAAPEGIARSDDDLGRWIEATAAWFAMEAEAVEAQYGEIGALIRKAAPALLLVAGDSGPAFVALVRGSKRTVTVVGSDRVLRRLPAEHLEAELRRPLEEPVVGVIDRMLERSVPPKRRARARAALLRERLGTRRVEGCWLLRARPGTSLIAHVRRLRLDNRLLLGLGAHVLAYGLELASWWAVAHGALQGRFDSGWLTAWMLILLTVVLVRMLGARSANAFATGTGSLLRTRLLAGALSLEPNEIRHQGAGQLLGRVLEASAVETLGVTGGFTSLVAVAEIIVSAFVLAAGAGALVHVASFLACVALLGFVGSRDVVRRRFWTELRLEMTHDLVERMVGHRTRIAQEARKRWHDGEDQAVERHLRASERLDGIATSVAFIPRLWLLVGIAGLAPSLLVGRPATMALATALGGVLLGHRALRSLASGIAALASAAIAWKRASALVDAAAKPERAPPPFAVSAASAQDKRDGALLLDAQDVRFRYRERGTPVLDGCSLRIHLGDRLLLKGASGGGKSTLASLLIGLRQPESGLLLLDGLDHPSLGARGWRRRIVAAPQFHENHVFTGTFAFNVLMGRRWPPRRVDHELAEEVCRELGLGNLLDRMPSGLQQIVGETGWQLSHGEKSRLFVARALLQDADLIVLDESFAALDPETLHQAIRCVSARARTLLVIAHP
jgi:ATP-binding cassette subfamily B protein